MNEPGYWPSVDVFQVAVSKECILWGLAGQ